MQETENAAGKINISIRLVALFSLTFLVGFVAARCGLDFHQITSATVFTLILTAATLFWDYHLPIAFVGIALLMIFDVQDIPGMIEQSNLDIILFLMAMMIIVGVLKDLGLFSWIIIQVISIRKLSARAFVVIYMVIGALASCMIDEVTAIVFLAALIFQVCDALNVKPVPFIIMAVMSANIGSTGTMLGNPVGILIGQNASPPLSIIDFMRWSFPIMAAELVVVLVFLLWNFRREIRVMDDCLRERREMGLTLGPIVDVPFGKGLFVLILMVATLSLHTVIEDRLGLGRNTMLIATPMFLSGMLILWRRGRVHKYVAEDVEWNTLIFFMMLFVVAGSLEHTKVTARIAEGFVSSFGDRPSVLISVVLGISAVGSAFIENIIFVASFMPVVLRLDDMPYLWALLHGACLGGNVTMIGSTANIAAMSMIEKRYWTRVNFFTWLRTGLAVGVLSCLVAWVCLTLMAPHMPTREERMRSAARNAQTRAEAATAAARNAFKDIAPEEAARRIRAGGGAVLVDVRTPGEHAEKRIPGSVLLPLASPGEMRRAAERLFPDKSTPLFLYCRSGVRSVSAANILADLGYVNVYNLGGVDSWPYATEAGD